MTETRGRRAAQLTGHALPHPASGDTLTRFATLARLARADLVTARFIEAHADAQAITTDLGAPDLVEPGSHWGVWAAEPPQPQLTAAEAAGAWSLTGTKPWCSGAGMCTHALVTAREESGQVGFFAVDLRQDGVRAVPETWPAVGMAASDSGWVEFDTVPARRLGSHRDYLDRPGFWHGGAGVAACWYGGARAVAEPLLAKALREGVSPLIAAQAGAVAAELAAGWALLESTAAFIDADPGNSSGLMMARALAVRTRIDRMAADVIERVGRALGAGPLCGNGEHAQLVADLSVYIRQTHAEADEAAIAAQITEHSADTAPTAAWDQLIGLAPAHD